MATVRRIPSYSQVGDEVVNTTPPQFGDGTDGQAPDTPSDPLDALHTLLTNGAQYQATPDLSNGTSRNEALSEALGRKYGVDSSAPQVDLEALDNFFRGADVQDALSKTLPVEQAKDQAAASLEQAKARNVLDAENLRGQYALQGDAMKAQAAENLAGAKAGAGAVSPEEANYWADQVVRDGSTLAKLPNNVKGAVAQALSAKGVDFNTLTNQSRAMAETANALLNPLPGESMGRLDQLEQNARDLEKSGGFGLLNSPIRRFFAEHGATSLVGASPDAPAKASFFETQLGEVQKEIQKALAGSRGASAAGLIQQFQKLIDAKGDLPSFLGQLEATRNMLTPYATMGGYAPASSGASDPYANPNYQPR